jgi:hypothetical protein
MKRRWRLAALAGLLAIPRAAAAAGSDPADTTQLFLGGNGSIWRVAGAGTDRNDASSGASLFSFFRLEPRSFTFEAENSASVGYGSAHTDIRYDGRLLAGGRLPLEHGQLVGRIGIGGQIVSNDAIRFEYIAPVAELAYRNAAGRWRFELGPSGAFSRGGCFQIGAFDCTNLIDAFGAGGFARIDGPQVSISGEGSHFFGSHAGAERNVSELQLLACGRMFLQLCVVGTSIFGRLNVPGISPVTAFEGGLAVGWGSAAPPMPWSTGSP